MNLATLIPFVLQTSIFLLVFGLGLEADPQDALYLFRRPSQLVRSLLAMNIFMPLFAAALAAAFEFHPAVEIALIALAVSPVPPILPKKQVKAGGHASYAIGLLIVAALFAVVFVPVAIELIGGFFRKSVHIAPAAVARLVLVTVLVPLAAGMVVRRIMPVLAERLAQPLSQAATVLLVVAVLPVLFTSWHAIVSLIGNGTLLAIAVFIVAGLAVGHLLGGPDSDARAVLALSTASRHPGVAMAIASANFPEQKLVPAAILLYLLVSAVVTIPYLNRLRRSRAGVVGAVQI